MPQIFRLLCILIFTSSVFRPEANAQEASKIATQLAEYCYHFQFKSADSLLTAIDKQLAGRKNSEFLLLKANTLWWQVISGNDSKSLRDTYYHTLFDAESQLEKEVSDSYAQLYKKICLYGYLARMDGLNKSYLKAFFRIRNCFKYLKKSFEHEAEYAPFYLSSGLYNYYMVTVAKKYPVVVPYLYFYPDGDLPRGIQYLENAAASTNRLLSTEATYFLMKIYLDDAKYAQSLIYSSRLVQLYPSNGLFLYYHFYALHKSNKPEEARAVLKKIYLASKNKELSSTQVNYFTQLAEKDLKNPQP